MLVYCIFIGLIMLTMVGVSVFASLITYWPYNLDLTLANYDFDRVDDTGWRAYTNSLTLALWTMIAGTFVVFSGAYLVEKTRRFALVRGVVHLLSMIRSRYRVWFSGSPTSCSSTTPPTRSISCSAQWPFWSSAP